MVASAVNIVAWIKHPAHFIFNVWKRIVTLSVAYRQAGPAGENSGTLEFGNKPSSNVLVCQAVNMQNATMGWKLDAICTLAICAARKLVT